MQAASAGHRSAPADYFPSLREPKPAAARKQESLEEMLATARLIAQVTGGTVVKRGK